MKNIIPNIHKNLFFAQPVFETNDVVTGFALLPIVAWHIKDYRITPIAISRDNNNNYELEIIYDETTDNWFYCNSDRHGSGEADLLKVLNAHAEFSIDTSDFLNNNQRGQ